MKRNTIAIGLFLFFLVPIKAQHCGPFMGIEDSISWNQKYRIAEDRTFSIDRDRWQYLGFHFQENPQKEPWNQKYSKQEPAWKDIEKKYRFALPVRAQFYAGYFFASPTGNGFALTGFPYCTVYSDKQEKEPTLLYFYDPSGKLVKEFKLRQFLTPKEVSFCGSHQLQKKDWKKIWDNCFDFSEAKGCVKFYTFADRPRLSKNGYFLEFCLANTKRKLYFFLPLQVFFQDQINFERNLISWLKGKLTDKRFHLPLHFQYDLELFQGLLHYSNLQIQEATKERLSQIIPANIHPKINDVSHWSQTLTKHKKKLFWEQKLQKFILKN